MFNKLSLLTLAAPLANALVLNIPPNPVSGGEVTITWTFTAGDPTFSLELVNEQFHNSFAIANNLQPELQQITITLPIVPVGDGYTLEAVNVGNIGQVFSNTGDFAIGANPSATPSSTSQAATTSAAASSAATAPTTAKTSLPASGSGVTHASSPTGSAFGSTVTSPSGSAATNAASNSASASGAAATTINAGFSNYQFGGNKGAMAAALLSALAGAAIVVL